MPDYHDATALAELVKTKQASPLELVDDAIRRIEQVNPALNAVILPLFEQARDAARGAIPDGPFRGVPYLVKDILAACAGVPMTSGSRMLKDYVPDHDSELVRRLRRAGFIFVGKTNTPEFGFLPTTEPVLFGATKNPWNLGHSVGGSSGGSSAAVAARIVPAAHANDGGGSIRIPASCCGLFGLKPTRGRITLGPDLGDVMGGFVVEHAVTLSVRDSAAILDVTEGPMPGDPYFAPRPVRPYVEEARTAPGRLRIALSTRAATGVPVHEDCVAAARDAARLCESLGHHVEEREPPISGDLLMQAFMVPWAAGATATLDGLGMLGGVAATRDNVEPLSFALAELGRKHSAAAYLMSTTFLQRIAREVARFMADYDVWLTPTLAEPPPPLGSFDAPPDSPLAPLLRSGAFSPFTPIQNVTGDPAMSVPLYWNAAGLPVGAHFAARYGEEATLFRLAAELEASRPWIERVPPVVASA
ncbi:MAG: amidase family protein [Sorangiineae bacterium]|nr:amidase family protein [Polyangiaceae bacterium]MEB2322974.1 amidase family protein [Sorangiineae bacterium]